MVDDEVLVRMGAPVRRVASAGCRRSRRSLVGLEQHGDGCEGHDGRISRDDLDGQYTRRSRRLVARHLVAACTGGRCDRVRSARGLSRLADGRAIAITSIARTQLDVVEIVGMQENLVVVDAGALAQGIDRDGRVSVYGVYFDVNKATVKPESTLSEARARAVVAALVDGHGISAARLEGHGVGPLAPVASSAEPAARAKNQRVELVAR